MGKRARRRGKDGSPGGSASSGKGGPSSFADLGLDLDLDVSADDLAEGGTVDRELDGALGVLTLRTVMSPGTRTEYAAVRKGERSSPSAVREDAWHRALEFLYERLVTGWDVAGVPTAGQKALLQRLRVSTPGERQAIRDALRAHLAQHLPDVEAP